MKLQFRHQQFQSDAAAAICDVFAGQPFHAQPRTNAQTLKQNFYKLLTVVNRHDILISQI